MKIDVKIPTIGESVNTAIIGSWQKSQGDFVHQNDILVLLETDKASVEVPAENTGQLEILKKEEEEASVGEVIARIDTSVKAPASPPSTKKETSQSTTVSSSTEPISTPKKSTIEPTVIPSNTSPSSFKASQFSPAVRHLLLEKNISPQSIQGTGKDGRIKKADVFKVSPSSSTPPLPPQEVQPLKSTGEETRREKMTTIRKRIAERLVTSQHNTATLTTFNEADMTRVMALRKEYQEVFKKRYGIKLGFMGFFIKAVIQALKSYPRVGAKIEGNEVVYHNHCHISIAVSTKRGLIVPVIKYADLMSIIQIEKAVLHFAEKARTGQIRPDDLTGGTFTISNGGVFGSLLSTPILNPPQSGILGMHKIEKRPVALNNEVVIRPMMYLALSYDHRIVDGSESVGFLVTVKECIEEPTRILLDI